MILFDHDHIYLCRFWWVCPKMRFCSNIWLHIFIFCITVLLLLIKLEGKSTWRAGKRPKSLWNQEYPQLGLSHQHYLKTSINPVHNFLRYFVHSHTTSLVEAKLWRLLKLTYATADSVFKSHHLWKLLLNFLPSCPDWVNVNITEEPQATHFKDAEHVASSWNIEAYQTFRRVQTAGWWSAWCVPLQTGLHFKVTCLNLLSYRFQKRNYA